MKRSHRRSAFIAALALLAAAGRAARAEEANAAPGVNPKDNITKTEILYRYDSLDLGDNSQSLTFKYDKAFNANWGGNLEVPIVGYKGFGIDEAGLGDVQARVRYTGQIGTTSIILGGEFVLPTASDDALGRGKYQFNPAVGAVVPLSQTAFVYFGYKHYFSVGGDDDRADINESQPRILAAYTSPKGWWILGDVKYTKSWEGDETEQLDLEMEFGRMVAADTGIWARIGTSMLDSDREASLNLGVRFIR